MKIEVEPDVFMEREKVLADANATRKAAETSRLKLAALVHMIETESALIESLGVNGFSRDAASLVSRWLIEGEIPATPFEVLVGIKRRD
jgi:hypothetical protein